MQLFEDLYGSDMLNYHNSKIDFFSALFHVGGPMFPCRWQGLPICRADHHAEEGSILLSLTSCTIHCTSRCTKYKDSLCPHWTSQK